MPTSGNDSLLTDYPWHGDASWQNASVREFLTCVELWCPAKTAIGGSSRRPQLPRKASEKRDSIGAVLGGEERKLREKPSWFRAQGSSSTTNGNWRIARCKLFEEHDRCTLNIYVDETILQYSIYIHLLRCTDIRPAHRSLLMSNDCLGIHVKPGQRWLDTNVEESIFVKFPNSALLNSWLALLRSYALPEIYGGHQAPSDGGLYRMWRQVQMEINQARNFGTTKPIDMMSDVASDSEMNTDGVEMEVSCEILVGRALCGRTTIKKCTGSPEWHEQYTFGDLPPFDDLVINVYREKKAAKPQLLGSVQIALINCRRGEMVEGWFPVICADDSVNGTQIGEMLLKLKIDEEIVLPASAYASVLQCMAKGNLLDLLNDMEQELRIGFVAEHIMAIAVARNVLMHDIFEQAEREVLDASTSHNTLFRGNTVLTKTMELAMNWYGKDFLDASVGGIIRRIISEKVAIEVDPNRTARNPKDQEKKGPKDQDRLVYWCNELWTNIYNTREQCPQELRELFQYIRQLIERKFESTNIDIRWQGVSAFCFLRFIVPAILHPHLFGLCHGMPTQPVQRSLTLIAKVLQSLANLNTTGQKEEFMKGVNAFHQENIPRMSQYLKYISTSGPDRTKKKALPEDGDNHIQAMNALRERKHALPTLHREALLFLPHLLDIPKHLAVLTSSVVRHAKQLRQHEAIQCETLKTFVACCFEVENIALKRVQQLLRPRAQTIRYQPAPRSEMLSHQSSKESASSLTGMEEEGQRFSERRRTVTRPSTAPHSDRRQQWNSEGETPLPNSPTNEETRQSLMQRKDGSMGPNRRGSVEASRLNSHTSDVKRNLAGSAHGRTDSATDPLIASDAEDGKKRKGFLRGLLTKR